MPRTDKHQVFDQAGNMIAEQVVVISDEEIAAEEAEARKVFKRGHGWETIDWAEIEGVPGAFVPAAHGHDWGQVTGKPSTFPPVIGGGSTQAAAGDDSRFPTTGQKNALAGSQGTPGDANRYVTNADARLADARTPLAHTHAQYQDTAQKGVASGYAGLDGTGKVPAAQLPAAGGGAWTRVVLSADVPMSLVVNTLTDIPGLGVAVLANTNYWFRFWIVYTAATATTGSRWTINGPAATALIYRSEYTLTATTSTRNAMLNAYNLPAAANATSLAAPAYNWAEIQGFVRPSAGGTLVPRGASEVVSSAVIAKAGSFVEFSTA